MSRADDFLDGKISADDFLDASTYRGKVTREPLDYPLDIYSNPISGSETAKLAIKQIPVVTSTLGAVGGAGLGAMSPIPGGAYMGGVGGAAIGGGLGDLMSNMLLQRLGLAPEKPMQENMDSAMKEGAIMGGFQAIPFGAVLRPFAKNITKEGMAIKEASEAMNAAVHPSTITNSRGGRFLEWALGESLPTGKAVVQSKAGGLERKILDERVNVLGEITGQQAALEGKTFKEGASDVNQALLDKAKGKYAEIVKQGGGKDTQISVEETLQYLQEIKDSPLVTKNETLRNIIGRFMDNAQNGKVTLAELDAFQKKVWTAAGRNSSTGKNIWSNLEKDITLWDKEQGKDLFEIIKGAKESYAEKSQFEYVYNLLKKSTRMKEGAEVLNADRFYGEVSKENVKRYIQQNFGPDAYKNLFTFATMAKTAAQEAKKSGMSGLESAWQSGASLGGLATALRPELALPYGASAIIANSMMKPHGWVKKWLTTGFGDEVTGQAMRIGGRSLLTNDAGDIMIGNLGE